jgi:hypothetical protein
MSKLPPIDFEIVWIDETVDTRPSAPGNLVLCPIIEVQPIRRQNLTAAIVAASNLARMHRSARGFYVRRKR